jgi:glycosyltransferase involved in cell wall biosynthesis
LVISFKSRALVYLTFNGVYQNTNGIGRQTATIVGTVERHWAAICEEFGPTSFFVVTPAAYNALMWGTSVDGPLHVQAAAERTGGTLSSLIVPDGEFWSVCTWRILCEAAGQRIAELTGTFAEVLVIAVDAPYLHVGVPLTARCSNRLRVVHCPYSSYLLSASLEPHPDRENWEADAYRQIHSSPTVHVADVCRFMTRHLVARYELPARVFVPFESSLDLDSRDFQLDDEATIAGTLDRYGVPRDQPLLLAFGRAHPIKGLDVLLRALQDFPERALHVVIVAVPYPGDERYLASLRSLAGRTGLGVTFIDHYDRTLPRAASQWRNTRVACCPSRVDTLPNVPMEVGLWARKGGPIVIASATGGLPECVDDGRTGILFPNGDAAALRTTVLSVLRTPPSVFDPMRQAACEKVYSERNQHTNLVRLLRVVWGR